MNILMFCSNPVNGGTARIFYELVTLFKTLLSEEDKLYACVNEENPVEIYKKIDGLCRLPIYSAQELYANLYGGNICKRLVNSAVRKAKYRKTQKNNINVMEQFIIDNNIDSVIIHNGGYVGDDLCNQMLTAAHCSKCVSHNVFVLHNDMEKNLLTKLRYMSYDKRISREATEIVTVSNYTRDRMVENSFIEKEIEVIYNGLTINKVMTQEEKAKHIIVNNNLRNILMIGNFAQNKGQREFIEAAAELLKDKNLEIHFTLIGNVYDATYFEQCMAYIRNKKIEEAFSIYHGVHNAYEYIDMFDMLVVPSLYDESFGLISLEAMANGRPVVAFACGGIPEVVQDGRDGLVVPVGDSHKMAEAIKWLVNNPKECQEMGKNGLLDYEEKFSAEAMAKNYFDIIRK